MRQTRKNGRDKRSLFFLLGVLPALAVAVSCMVIFKTLKHYVTSSSYFEVKDLRVEGLDDARTVGLLRGEVMGVNTFRLDLKALAEKIKRRFPNFYSVVVTRVLPSQVVVVARERLPAAVLKRDAFYVLDADGVVLSASAGQNIFALPLIVGLENKLPAVKVGASYSSPGLLAALRLARAVAAIEKSLPRDFGLNMTKIDASDAGRLSFALGEDLEIKVGGGDFDSRLKLLPAILESIAGELKEVRYIDLRPREPVVAHKDKKK